MWKRRTPRQGFGTVRLVELFAEMLLTSVCRLGLDEVIGAATTEGAPSTNARASLYRTYQMGPGRILDGRFGDGGTVNIGPPIELYHAVFAKFRADLKDASKNPTTQIIQATANLMRSTSEIMESERLCAVRTRRLLSNLMGCELVQVVNFNRTSPNCVSLSLEIPPKGTVAPLLMEEKGTGNDPCAQAGLSFLKYWADPSVGILLWQITKSFDDAVLCSARIFARRVVARPSLWQ